MADQHRSKGQSHDPDPESWPWDENDWERFMRKADVRTAKYLELYETLRHHSQRDLLIAKEMGWEALWAQCQAKRKDCEQCAERTRCEAHALRRIGAALDGEDGESAEAVSQFEQVKTIPAYVNAHEFCIRLHTYFTRHLSDDAYADEDVRQAISSAHLVPAKIAGGHGIGYERDALCGNIANCKRALKKADACVQALEDIVSRHLVPEGDGIVLLAEAEAVRRDVANWIANLRARIGHPPPPRGR